MGILSRKIEKLGSWWWVCKGKVGMVRAVVTNEHRRTMPAEVWRKQITNSMGLCGNLNSIIVF
jgi:hypothetical protein